MDLADLRITSVAPTPVDETGLVDRLRLTAVAAAYALTAIPALALLIVTVVAWPLVLIGAGLGLLHLAVPTTERLTRLHRTFSGVLLGDEIDAQYADTTGKGFISRPVTWLQDAARWRDFAFLAFSATGGFVMSLIVPAMLLTPFVHLVGAVFDGGIFWWTLFLLGVPLGAAWWAATPALVRGRAFAERGILGGSRVEQLERRVEEVAESRSETLDHSAAEIRRIERDLHDGAQAGIVLVGMNVGLAEKLVATDPDAAVELLREARESTVSALEDLRSVVRGIHPPVLADRGLAGGIEALAMPMPFPVTLSLDVPGDLAAPIESAAYFAVAECLTNTVKHAAASRAWITATHADDVLHLVVGDDGLGGADAGGSGLAGVAKRLISFDGTMTVSSPVGGPTIVTMEVPCALSSPKTTPSSESD